MFGLARYLLVSGPLSIYGVHYRESNAIYHVDVGAPNAPATIISGVYVRQFANATVAVNPGQRRARRSTCRRRGASRSSPARP